MIFNGVSGISDDIVIQPSASMAGQVFDNDAATGTPIAVVNYTVNTNIIVNGNDGSAGDTDSLTLRGTDPANPGTSGNDNFDIDLTRAGGPGTEKVRVTDAVGAVPLYNLQNFTNFNTLNVQMLGGFDSATVVGQTDGAVALVINGGANAALDSVTFTGTANAVDSFSIVDGPTNDTATAFIQKSGAIAPTRIQLNRVGTITADGGGGTGVDNVYVFGSKAANNFAVQYSSAFAGSVSVDSFPLVNYSNLGSGTLGVFSVIILASDDGSNGNPDSVQFIGAALIADTYTYTPTSEYNATLKLTAGGNSVNFSLSNFGSAALDAATPGGASVLNVAVTDAIITPGPVSGSGTVTATNAGGQGLLPLSYTDVGSTAVTGGTVVVDGTPDDDVITVSATGIVTVANSGGVVLDTYDLSGAVNALIIDALGGNDTINITSSGLFPGGITVLGGEPGSGSDSLVINTTVAKASPTVNFTTNQVTGVVGGPIAISGIEDLTVNGLDGTLNAFTVTGYGSATDVKTLTLNGGDTNNNDNDTIDVTATAGPDTIQYTPLSASTGTVQRLEGGPVINITGFNSADNDLSLNASGGIDAVQVVAPVGNDSIQVIQGGLGTRVTVTANGNPSGGVKWVPLDFAGVSALRVDGGAGNDRLVVDNSNGLVALTSGVTYDGGTGNNTLQLLGYTATGTTTYNPGPDGSSGAVLRGTQSVFFTNVQPVQIIGFGSGDTLNIGSVLPPAALNADNAINFTAGPGGGIFTGNTGLVSVNNYETIEFNNYGTLVINAGPGSDEINLDDATQPALLTGITVHGGDPTASDTLIVNGTTGNDTIEYDPTGIGAGTVAVNALPTVTFDTIEALDIDGQGGIDALTLKTHTTLTGVDQVTYTPARRPMPGRSPHAMQSTA